MAALTGREVRASGLCHADPHFATHALVPTQSVLGHEVARSWPQSGQMSGNSASAITLWALSPRRVGRAFDAWLAGVFSCDIPMYADLYLQDRMYLYDPVSGRISLREVNDGYAGAQGRLTTRVVTSFGL